MFFIIGGDRQQYGPSSAEELRDWIRQGRADRNTLARLDGTADWKPLGAFPEFAEILGIPAQPAPPPQAQALREILASEPDFSIGECFSHAGSLLASNFGILVGAAIMVWFLDALVTPVPFLGLLLQGVLYGGLALVYLRKIRGMEASPMMVFAGFGGGFMQLALAGLVTALLAGLGSFLCYLPFVYLKVAWALTLPLIVDKGMEFWSAMEVCRRVTTRVWFRMFWLMLLVFSPYILAQSYVTIHTYDLLQQKLNPAMPADLTDILRDLPGIIAKVTPALKEVLEATRNMMLLAQLVWLVNLPFGTAVMMYAYEALFNPGKKPRSQ